MHTILVASQSAAMRAGIHALLGVDPDFTFLTDKTDSSSGFSADERGAILIFHEEDWEWLQPVVDSTQYILMIGDQFSSMQSLIHAGRKNWGMISLRSSAEDLRAALAAIKQGLVVIPAKFSSRLAAVSSDFLTNPDSIDDLAEPLTERELEVLALLTRGLQNKQIALKLNISENTIKFHISSIYSKLGVSNRTEAVRRGAQLGLVAL